MICEQAGAFAYDDRLVPIKSRKTFDVGTYVHALSEHALREHARTGSTTALDERAAAEVCKQLKREEGTDIDEVDAVAGLAAAQESLRRIDLDRWETVRGKDGSPCIELTLVVPWRGHELEVRIDWIARSLDTGKVWIIDHKTTRSSIDDDPGTVEFDLQLALYREAAEIAGIHVDGAMHNLIRVTKNVEPYVLEKSGKLSRAKTKNAMPWPLYEQAVIDRGEDPADYADMREALEARRWSMWRPDVTSDLGRENILNEAERALWRMQEPGETLAARLPYGACDRCAYQTLCDYKLDGKDPSSLLGVVYKAKDEDSPHHGAETFDEDGLADYFARAQRTGKYDVKAFKP